MKNERSITGDALSVNLPRRQFLIKVGLGLGAAAALDPLSIINAAENTDLSVDALKDNRYFRFAVISDTHIIDEFYKGPESNQLDSESVFLTTQRLTSVRKFINDLSPPFEQVFVCGDFFHDYPSPDYDFYYKNRTRIDNAKELIDGFKMPVHVALGNHDYDVPRVSREMSQRLFKEKLKIEPYYSVNYKGYKFIILNNFLGTTWDQSSKDYNKQIGSYGETQLNWFEAELKARMPTFIFQHYPLYNMKEVEVTDYGILPLLKKYQDTIQIFFSGHWHRWFDFAKTYGPQHYTVASTRYDEDNYMLVEVDTKTKTWKILNHNCLEWATRNSIAYKP